MDSQDDDRGSSINFSVENQKVSIIPECDLELKPYVGMKFQFLEEGLQFYRNYAAACGFDTRLGTTTMAKDKTVVAKYILCNKEGVKGVSSCGVESDADQSKKNRRRLSSRTSCMARVIFHLVAGEGYVVKTFIEGHNHNLVSVGYRHFMKINRKLEKAHKRFIFDCAKSRIGPMRSFRVFKELIGGYDNIGCTIVDFKNFTRDLRSYVGGADAQMMLDKLKQKSELCPGFKFDFCVSASEKLTRVFWYNMIFSPFTGKDNHGRCVTFAVGLLSSEDVESYSWIFQKFKECVDRDPKLLITDQDPAMKIVVERIFPDTRHRFCMWHIMLKVSDKIPKILKEDESFAVKFNGIVWSEHLEPTQFDEKWHVIMEEFGLSGHKWFVKMFDLRSYWIPAYFRDVHLSGLFKTTSMSESENIFFIRYLSRGSNLVEFLMHYGSAMDAQRNAHDQLSHMDESCFPDTKTKWPLEKHAASVYPHQIFYDAQKQIIAAADNCSIMGISTDSESTVYEDDDDLNGKFRIVHTLSEDYVDADAAASNEVVSDFYSCFGLVKGSNHMSDFRRDMSALKDKYFNRIHSSSLGHGKNDALHELYGFVVPENIVVLPPDMVKTKGSGRRFKSKKETEVLRTLRAPRRCNKCKKMCHHDARNCPSDLPSNTDV